MGATAAPHTPPHLQCSLLPHGHLWLAFVVAGIVTVIHFFNHYRGNPYTLYNKTRDFPKGKLFSITEHDVLLSRLLRTLTVNLPPPSLPSLPHTPHLYKRLCVRSRDTCAVRGRRADGVWMVCVGGRRYLSRRPAMQPHYAHTAVHCFMFCTLLI